MKEYLYVYRGGEEARIAMEEDPKKRDEINGKWKTWLENLAKTGKLSNPGNPLNPQGKVLSGKTKKITDGPFIEAKEIIGGYSIVKAGDLNEAAELAKGCPGLEYGGTVEIREVNQLAM
jgi:hypothetical protein